MSVGNILVRSSDNEAISKSDSYAGSPSMRHNQRAKELPCRAIHPARRLGSGRSADCDHLTLGATVGFMDWVRRDTGKADEMMYFYEIGCEVKGTPPGGWWGSTLAERMDRVAAGRKEVQRRQVLGQVATERALSAAYRKAQAQRGRDVQFKEDGITVKVKNGYSDRFDSYTTDIILVDPGRPGQHLHIVLDENGDEIHQAWTENH